MKVKIDEYELDDNEDYDFYSDDDVGKFNIQDFRLGRCVELEKSRDFWREHCEKWHDFFEKEKEAHVYFETSLRKTEKRCHELSLEINTLTSQRDSLRCEVSILENKVKSLTDEIKQGEFYHEPFSETDYLNALLAIFIHKKVNIKFLSDEIKIPYNSAKALISYLEKRKLISKLNSGSVRKILFDETFVRNEYSLRAVSDDLIVFLNERLKSAKEMESEKSDMEE